MPKKQFILYCDESAKKGEYFSNFYGGALISASDREAIEAVLSAKKDELNLHKEVKWTRITENYRGKYIAFVDTYFDLIAAGKIKLRIMFTQNRFKPRNLTQEQHDNQYFILYYQLIKHAFGFAHSNPSRLDRLFVAVFLDQIPHTSDRAMEFKEHVARLSQTSGFRSAYVTIERGQVADVDSSAHSIMQGLDIVLGAMQFRLNNKHKEKPEGKRRRGKRTIAKDVVYQHINRRIRDLYPNFNIGVSTGSANGLTDRWAHPYRHWRFVPSEYDEDETLTKRR